MKLVFHTAEDGSEIEKVKYWGGIIAKVRLCLTGVAS
jgi:hypothetical protein